MATEEKERISGDAPRDGAVASSLLPTVNPDAEKPAPPAKAGVHASVYVIAWISLSSSVILFNKWILSSAQFNFPIVLTTWHLAFATLMTQLMARFTTTLDSRKSVPMTGRVYLRAIVPIGVFFSLSLICGNVTYLYLSVSFIQMLKATTPVAVLITSWVLGLSPPNFKTLGNVSFIVIGVIIASVGEIKFVLVGVLFQIGGILFEAIRLTLVQSLLSSAEFKMDPLVSLYYFAPACAVMNGVVALILEVPKLTMDDIYRVGIFVLIANAVVAFLLNVSVVFLIGKTSSLVLTLCGVLKDILLVCASLLIFQDPVSPLQAFGYSIALAGLIYYKLGSDKLKEYFFSANRRWSEYGANHPAMRKFIIFLVVLVVLFIVLGGITPFVPEEYQNQVVDKINGLTSSMSKTPVNPGEMGGR